MTQITSNALRITTESADRSWTGVAAAWANLNGTGTIALRDSQNIASVTDDGTGDYTFNLSSAMSAADYSVKLSSKIATFGGQARISGIASYGTSSATFECGYLSSGAVFTAEDSTDVCPSIHGDLA